MIADKSFLGFREALVRPATGKGLDNVADSLFGISRRPGETDEDLRDRVLGASVVRTVKEEG